MDMSSYNTVILLGRIGKVGELQHSKGSTRKFCRLSLATNEYFKGDDKPRTEWHNITTFGQRAEYASSYLKPGEYLLVVGKLRSHYYAKDGENRKYIDVHVQDLIPIRGVKPYQKEEEGDQEEDQEEEPEEEEEEEEPGELMKGEDPF